MTYPILYARRIPTNDETLKRLAPNAIKFDVILYRDKNGLQPVANIPWHYTKCPDRRHKWVNYNCARYALQWLPELNASDYPRQIAKTRRATYYEISPGLYNTHTGTSGGYPNLRSLMRLKGDYVFADYWQESPDA